MNTYSTEAYPGLQLKLLDKWRPVYASITEAYTGLHLSKSWWDVLRSVNIFIRIDKMVLHISIKFTDTVI